MMDRLYLKPSLCKAIAEYCEANNIDDVNAFANRCATQGFNIAKYGLSPGDNIERENNGIKDFKNEKGTRKKKEQQSKENDTGSVVQREEEKIAEGSVGLDGSNTGEENGKQTEEAKNNVIVRKIRITKKG
ncbi:MAG: hypothetical protein J6O49_05285 [Bacteroidaceae bacterium]|nr:hypothetical protein [Bacteroidaceae bacterium]